MTSENVIYKTFQRSQRYGKRYRMNELTEAAIVSGKKVAICTSQGAVGISLTEGGIGLEIEFMEYQEREVSRATMDEWRDELQKVLP